MGCGGSKNKTSEPEDKTEDSGDEEGVEIDEEGDDSFKEEMKGKRKTFDKKTGKGVEKDLDERAEDKKEGDLFEVEEAGKGEQFMATKPWVGAIVEPTEPKESNSSHPNLEYELEYVYGYRCEDSRQNCYFNKNQEAVYITAAVGVILEKNSNRQKFFGGGMTKSSSKHKAAKEATNQHTDDIMCLAMSTSREMAATGQVGSVPIIYIWNACTGAFIRQIKLPKGCRGVMALGFSLDDKWLAAADLHNDHNVYVFEVATGAQKYKGKGGPDKIFDIAWSKKEGDVRFVTAGIKHVKFWTPLETRKMRKGLYGGKGKMSSFACAAFDEKGQAYLGAMNGHVYKYVDRSLEKTFPVGKGLVHSINYTGGKLITGSADGHVRTYDESNTELKCFDVGAIPRSVDLWGEGQYLVGSKDGSIKEWINDRGEVLMEGHCEGEAWGLHVHQDHFISTGDDNQILVFNFRKRVLEHKAVINENPGSDREAGVGASTLSHLPPNQCARAIGFNQGNWDVAVGCNDGIVQIRESFDQLSTCKYTLTDSNEWVEVLEYSPDGRFLAVGSHDNNIYIYDVQNNYSLKSTLKAHNSYITSLDWSNDCKYIRSNCGAYELLFFDVDAGEHDPSGATNTKDLDWHTHNNKLGWNVTGIFPPGTDGSHINGVAMSKDETLIATGDDYGLVNIYRNPSKEGHKCISLRAHSEHVVRVMFSEDDSYLFSIGGYDQTIMQWKLIEE